MENETIAKLISIFETSTLTIAILLAIAGIAMLIMRARSSEDNSATTPANNANAAPAAPQKTSRVKRIFQNVIIRILCIAALAAFLPELTYFNYAYYLRFFAGNEIATTTLDPENQHLLRLTNGGVAGLFEVETGNARKGGMGLRFNDLNKIVTSIHIDAIHGHDENLLLRVEWRDEEGTPYSFQKNLFRGLPHGYYIPLQPRGEVKELALSFFAHAGMNINVVRVTLNKPIPFYISGLRLLVLTLILFVIFSLANKEARAKLSCFLFQYKFDATNKKQTYIYIATVLLILVLSWLSVYTSLNIKDWARPSHQMYNVYLVDALIAGRTWLDYGNPEKLLEWEQPYNYNWRVANEKRVNIDWMYEWTWYNGKYYTYFGVVPAVVLHVPYKLITGQYLTNHGSIFIFCAVAIVMLALLWRYCVRKWMPNMRFAFFMLGFLTLYFTAGLSPLFCFARFHSIVQAAGLMFAITGIYLLLKSIDKEKINLLLLFFACLSFALIAGCRPNMVFISILVPFVLWKRKSWKIFAVVASAYIIVAIPLMWYNYIRFNAVTDFGWQYTLAGGMGSGVSNPIGNILGTLFGTVRYLFLPAQYSLEFPYVGIIGWGETTSIKWHFIAHHAGNFGLINYPIVLCLLCMLRNTFRKRDGLLQDALPLVYGSLATGCIILIVIASTLLPITRYLSDFTVFVILPSLFCAYAFCHETENETSPKMHMKLTYLLMIISITVGAFISITGTFGQGGRNPLLYQYLESVLSII